MRDNVVSLAQAAAHEQRCARVAERQAIGLRQGGRQPIVSIAAALSSPVPQDYQIEDPERQDDADVHDQSQPELIL